jgi:phage-related protein
LSKKPLKFLGTSYEDLCAFPKEARRMAGADLLLVQVGSMPKDFKPMFLVGHGAYEIRIHRDGEWRVMYVAKSGEVIYVLHAFQKKTQKTPKADIEIAQKRYRLIGGQ